MVRIFCRIRAINQFWSSILDTNDLSLSTDRPFDGADVLPAGNVNLVGLGIILTHHAGNFFGLPVNYAGRDKGEATAGIDLFMDFPRINAPPSSVINIPCQRVELFHFEQTLSNAGTQLWLREIAQNEFSF